MSARAIMRRLSRLETEQRGARSDGICDECGAGGAASPKVVFHIPVPKCFGDPHDEPDDTSRDFCGACGRQRVFRWRIPSPRIMGRETTEAEA